jgi:hypothetical protein
MYNSYSQKLRLKMIRVHSVQNSVSFRTEGVL